jgi:hypothetical protein
MSSADGPGRAREAVDRLESDIVDVDQAADDGTDGDESTTDATDATGRVPGSPEPPD